MLFLILQFSFTQAAAFQGERDDIDWYQSFFLETKQKPAEEDIVLSTTKLDKAIESDDLNGQAKALNEIGLIYLTRTHDYEKAMEFFIQALAIEDSLDLTEQQIFTYLGISRVFEEVSDYYKSAHFLEQALHANERDRNIHILVLILNKLGKVNSLLGRNEEAFQNYQQVLNYKDELDQPAMEAEALFNLAHFYTVQEKYNEALSNHKQALSIRRSIQDRKNEAHSLNAIGELYQLMKNDDKALANHIVALEIRQALKDKKGIAESYNNIGVLFFNQKNIERASANLGLALQAGQESQAQDQMARSYDYLNQCFKALGDYKKALEYKELFLAISDFIRNEKNERQLLETQNRYVVEQQESQIGKLESDRIQREKEIQVQKNLRNLLIILIVLGLIIIALTLYLYISKRRSNNVLQAANAKVNQQNLQLVDLNATKDKFFSIISHDLKGPLNSLTSFSGLLINHTDSLSKEEIKMLAKDLDKSLKNLFALLENLLEWSRSQTGNIDFKSEIFGLNDLLDLNKELLKTQAENKRITIDNTSKTNVQIDAHKHSVNTVIRNLMSNAIKFTPEAGTITLGLKQNAKEVIVSIADTGVGMSEEVIQKLFRIDTKHTTKGTADEKGTGLGLILCKEFIEKNGGRIWAESTPRKGSVFYFTLPIEGAPREYRNINLPASSIQYPASRL